MTAPYLNLAAAWKDISRGRFSDTDRSFFYSGAVAMNAILVKLQELHGDKPEAFQILFDAVQTELQEFTDKMVELAMAEIGA